MTIAGFQNFLRSGTYETVTASLLRGGGLEEKGVLGIFFVGRFRGGGDLEVGGGGGDKVGGDLGVHWDEVWWVWLRCCVPKQLVDGSQGRLKFVLDGVSIRYQGIEGYIVVLLTPCAIVNVGVV